MVSARLHGRALGGMADTMRRRIVQVDLFLDARLEPALDATRRSRICGRLRCMWQSGTGEAAELQQLAAKLRISSEFLARRFAIIPAGGAADPVVSPPSAGREYFGARWARIEQLSPVLQRRRVPLENLSTEAGRAKRILDRLRNAADQADSKLRVAAD